jgi:hypothetical protein
MTDVPPESESAQWIVQGADVASGSLSAAIKDDPAVRAVRRIGADVMVLHMSQERAEKLRAQFGRLAIEIDQSLNPPLGP